MMKKYLAVIMAVLMVTGLFGCEKHKDPMMDSVSESTISNSYTQISMKEAVAMMEEESDYIILDVRTPEEFVEKHIPNAVNVPNEVIGDDDISELPNKDQLILVYCRSGNRSKQASQKLVELGYTNIYEFGGINEWTGETMQGTGETESVEDITVENVKNLIEELPALEDVESMSLEDQRIIYDQTQAAYEAYSQLAEEERDMLFKEYEKIEELFGYFNTLVEPAE